MNLELECNKEAISDAPIFKSGNSIVMVTPAIGEDYWLFRVKLSDTQAILGFPKFTTIGIGFAQEEDWNTNLPYTADTDKILDHIIHNKGDENIGDDQVREAIQMVQKAAAHYKQQQKQ